MKTNKILLAAACILLLVSVGGSLATIELARLKLLNRESWILFGGGSEWFWGFLQFATVAITLAFIYNQLHLSTASHVLQSMTSLNERWSSDRQVTLRKITCEAWLGSNRSLNTEGQIFFHFFEELGLYAKKQWIPLDVIWETYSWYIESYWGTFAKDIHRLRVSNDDSSIFQNFEYLAKMMSTINKKRGVPAGPKAEETLESFARGEVKTCLLSQSA